MANSFSETQWQEVGTGQRNHGRTFHQSRVCPRLLCSVPQTRIVSSSNVQCALSGIVYNVFIFTISLHLSKLQRLKMSKLHEEAYGGTTTATRTLFKTKFYFLPFLIILQFLQVIPHAKCVSAFQDYNWREEYCCLEWKLRIYLASST